MAEETDAGKSGSRLVPAVGYAAFGVAAGAGAAAAGGAALVRADRRRERPLGLSELEMPDDLLEHDIETSDGGRLHVVERGEGRPVVLLHGITLSSRIWPYQLRSLVEAGHRVLAVDHRGHGLSRAGSRGATVEAMAADVRDLFEALDLTGAIVVGHSMGSMVTIELAALHRELIRRRVEGLALIGASACSPALTRRITLLAYLVEGGAHLFDGRRGPLLPSGDFGYLLARLAFGTRPDPHHVGLTRDVSGAMSPASFSEILPSVLGYDGRDLLGGITVPTLVTVGPVDRFLPPSGARHLIEAIPGARGLELPGCGHMPMLERHAELDAALLELSAGLGPYSAAPAAAGARAAGSRSAADPSLNGAPKSRARGKVTAHE